MPDNAPTSEPQSPVEIALYEKVVALSRAVVAGQEEVLALRTKLAKSATTIQSVIGRVQNISLPQEELEKLERTNTKYLNEILLLREKIAVLEKSLASANSGAGDKETAAPYQDVRYIALHELFPGKKRKTTPTSDYINKTNGTLAQILCQIQTDENGFAVSEKQLCKGDTKILLLGGSSIENIFVEEDLRIATRIEKNFEAQEKSAKVYNGSRDGGSLLHMINNLVNKGIPLRPTYAVFYPTIADAGANGMANTFWNPVMSPIRIMGLESAQKDKGYYENNNYDDIRRLLRLLCDICGNFDIHLFLSTWPLYGSYDKFMQKHDKFMNFSVCEGMIKALNGVIREICLEKKCGLVDMEKKFEGLDHHKYFYDWYHPNAVGCEYIAQITSEAIWASF